MVNRRPYDILLAGIGIGGRGNTTLATVELLRRARITFSLSVHTNWVRRLCKQVVALDDDFFTGEEDSKVYRRVANTVLEEAMRAPRVALVDDGHPLIYDDVCWDILKRGRRRGLLVVAQPAVSSIDVMVTECGVRMDYGFQMVEATTLVGKRQRLNPLFETLVLQIGWFGTSFLAPIEGHRRERFEPLQEYLLRFYPPEHRVRVLHARLSNDEAPSVVTSRLDRLSHQYRRIASDSTLHIPSVRSKKDWNLKFVDQIMDRNHLARIARL